MFLKDKLPLEIPTEAPGYSADLGGLVKWLSEQDPQTTYNYYDVGDCLICRFLRGGVGIPNLVSAAFNYWRDENRITHDIPPELNEVAISSVIDTYSSALTRARVLLSAANSGRAG